MRVERGEGWELRCGDWRDDDVPEVDAAIEDPPYGERTHAGQRHERNKRCGDLLSTKGIQYDHLTPDDVRELCYAAAEICMGWTVHMTSHDLIPAYEGALAECGRYTFAPLPVVIPGMNVRLAGDGPSNWTVYTIVSRRRRGPRKCWSTKPGAYRIGSCHADIRKLIAGTKPLELMEAIIRDYTDPGDLVLDRFTGSGTTGIAALRQGRRFIGWERKPEHFEIAVRRLQGRPPKLEGQEELWPA